jgi:hypothetical protein
VYVQGTLVLGTLASTLVTVCLHYFGDLRSLLGAMASESLPSIPQSDVDEVYYACALDYYSCEK